MTNRAKRHNPFGLSLPRIDAGSAIVIAGAIYFLPKLNDILNQMGANAPQRPADGPVGTPGTGGSNGGSVTYPSTASFRIDGVTIDKPFSPFGLSAGTQITVHWAVEHIGPADTFVAGVRLLRAGQSSTWTLNPEYLTSEIEQSFAVNAEGSYGRYTPQVTYTLPSDIPWLFSISGYVRNASGAHLADAWY